MLFFMVATSHFVPSGAFDSSEGGKRAIWYLALLVIAGVFEANALRAPAAGKPEAWYIDDHKNTIIAGFVLTAVLYLLLELLFG
jgi:hypothetical protein